METEEAEQVENSIVHRSLLAPPLFLSLPAVRVCVRVWPLSQQTMRTAATFY